MRVLLHYNGLGALKPTIQGDIYVTDLRKNVYNNISILDIIVKADNKDRTYLETMEYTFLIAHEVGGLLNTSMEILNTLRTYICLHHAVSFHLKIADEEELPNQRRLSYDLFSCCLLDPIKISINMVETSRDVQNSMYNKLRGDIVNI